MHCMVSYLLDVLEVARFSVEMQLESFEYILSLLVEYNENIFTWVEMVQGW